MINTNENQNRRIKEIKNRGKLIPLERPVTQITRAEKGAPDRAAMGSERSEDEAGDIGSNDCRPLKEDIGVERPTNSFEHPLLCTTSTLPLPPPPPPPITTT